MNGFAVALVLSGLIGFVAFAVIVFGIVRYFHLRGLDKQALDSLKQDAADKISKL